MHIIRAIMPADVKPAVEPMPSPRGALYSPKGAVYVRLEASEWMKRRDECLWSDPVMSLKNKLYSPAGAPIDYAGLESLEGKVIGCIRNYTYPVVEGLFAEGKAQRYDVNSDLVLLRMLKAGRIDAIVMDSIVVDWVIKKTPDLVRSDFYVAEKAVDVVGLRLVFNKKPGWEKRLPEINERIAKLRSDGTLKEIMARYQ